MNCLCVTLFFHARLILYLLQDVQNKLRELVQGVGDEFMTCRLATQAKVCI